MTVTGHSAALMGAGRLSADTQALLERAEAAEPAEWRDFRHDDKALDAQVSYLVPHSIGTENVVLNSLFQAASAPSRSTPRASSRASTKVARSPRASPSLSI